MTITGSIRPRFTRESALAKVQAAEDAWNSRDPGRVSMADTEDSVWRNRSELLRGRAEIRAFLIRKWPQGLTACRYASINDAPITEGEQRLFSPERPAVPRGASR